MMFSRSETIAWKEEGVRMAEELGVPFSKVEDWFNSKRKRRGGAFEDETKVDNQKFVEKSISKGNDAAIQLSE